ncbi:MAG: endopeptidase La [Bacteroidales bacterium]|nr:endopeptidase La [Bacteroidales bacterium]
MRHIKEKVMFSGLIDKESDIISILGDDSLPNEEEISNNLHLVPLRNSVFFPKVITPIFMGRKKSIDVIKKKYKENKIIGVVTQKKPNDDDPGIKDIYQYGTVARIIKILELPDGSQSAIVQGIKRFRIVEPISDEPFLVAKVELLEDILPKDNDSEFEALVSNIRHAAESIIHMHPTIGEEATMTIKNMEDAISLVNFICSNIEFPINDKLSLLQTADVSQRGYKLLSFLAIEIQKLQLRDNINVKVQKKLDESQKEFILNQQLKEIQKELGNDPTSKEITELKDKARKKKWSKKVKEVFEKELQRLERINHMSPEYGVQLSYLQTILDLPWDYKTKDNYDLERAQKVLDEDHYGLDKVKDRILEYLAVLKLKGNLKSPIICLYGPPGVGKTSLGKSVARALNRKYARMSLGGMHDESEIRGHRKTYIGAMPGRIIQSLKKVNTSNPVFVLDEIDKIGSDFRGDPGSALLEVLDPEQNNTFHDNYLDIDYDLSDVMFIATANNLSTVSPALIDRMEIIDMTGYLMEEKVEIAKQHLIPKQLSAHGIRKNQLKFTDQVLSFLIDNYTRESGVRELDKKVASIVRKVAKEVAFGQKFSAELTKEKIVDFLGAPRFTRTKYEESKVAGVVTGLAWTAAGGEIMTIEAIVSRGVGKLSMTGNLGKVMIESATIAYEFIKSHYKELNVHPQLFKHWNVHIHAPEGAIPKDGPSAGITITTGLASLFTQRKILPFTAMTGELTLSGKVLPVGGIKEKILAAKRAGIKQIVISELNKADVEEIKDIYREGIIFHYVKTMDDVLEIALLEEKVEKPMKIGIPKKKA